MEVLFSKLLNVNELWNESPRPSATKLPRELIEQEILTIIFVRHGDVALEIARIAEQQRVGLIVIAKFGKTGWRRFAFGSVTEKVVRLVPCKVLAHGQNPNAFLVINKGLHAV